MTDTTTPATPADKGWAKLADARKFHFYGADSRSLCGRYAAFAAPAEAFEPHQGGFTPAPDDCSACMKKLEKLTDKRAAK
ncbi:hypothetical protein ACWGJ9_11080 [Curtobacterium citreum]